MGQAGDHGPKRRERRYRQVSPERRRFYYLMRRLLYFTPAEVDAMSWAEQRMWSEEIVAHETEEGARNVRGDGTGDLMGLGFDVREVG